MLLPTVSVTMIGLLAGLIALLRGSYRPGPSLALGIAGAWIGFIAVPLRHVAQANAQSRTSPLQRSSAACASRGPPATPASTAGRVPAVLDDPLQLAGTEGLRLAGSANRCWP